MKTTLVTAFVAATFSALNFGVGAAADAFGSGANEFEIEFVTIGNPGNAPDVTGSPNPAGSVAEIYRIGKFEISEQMIEKANLVGGLGITKDTRGPDKPASNVNWFEAAKFVNWLNADAGSAPAYKFDGNGIFQLWQPGDAGYNPANQYRNGRAKYFLPSADEWYKAAYYDPATGVFYDYPTGSDSQPDGIDFTGDPDFDAVFLDPAAGPLPNDITDVGTLSPYGTGGQGGNVFEWEETAFDLVNDSNIATRGLRGGGWPDGIGNMRSSTRFGSGPGNDEAYGFRVASVPEPTTWLLAALSIAGLSVRKRMMG